MRKIRRFLVDLLIAIFALPAGYLLRRARRGWRYVPITRWLLRKAGVFPLREHYYEPVVFPEDLRRPLDAVRPIAGLDLDTDGQLALLGELDYAEELKRIPMTGRGNSSFNYRNGSFELGDAEFLYSMIRHFSPKRIIEVGSGHSTLMARLAIEANTEADHLYECDHVCIEPYEQPELEKCGARIIRERVELCDVTLFETLDANDILFIDSSHVIRPQGDVLFEYLEVLGRLRSGVQIHIHDIFTPRDYPSSWIIDDQKLWDEQYLLEAFLAFNREFKVTAALNHLHHSRRDELARACPMQAQHPEIEPRSFWIRRI